MTTHRMHTQEHKLLNQEQKEQDLRLTLQIELERLYNHNQTLTRIRKEFLENGQIDLQAYMEEHGVDPDFGIELLVQMVLHKRTTLPTLVSILRHHFVEKHGEYSASQVCADQLLKAAQADLVDWNGVTEQFVIRPGLNITQDVQEDLDRYQFPLPMIVPPKRLTHNKASPYLSLGDGSVILRKNHHDDDVCLDHLNRVNSYRFTFNNNVARMIHNRWRDLDKLKAGETRIEFERRKKAFEKYDRTARQVMAQVTLHGNCFYLTHKVDKRGRTYCQGYHCSYQSAPWNKAVIELYDKEIIP
jgi:hypothetical protein